MKRNLFGAALTLTFIVAALLSPMALAAPSAATLTAAYKAYYAELKADIDDWGSEVRQIPNDAPEMFGTDITFPSGVSGAILIDFENDGLRELVYFLYTGDYGSLMGTYGRVYGYGEASGIVLYENLFSGGDGGYVTHIEVVTAQNGISYIQTTIWDSFGEYDDANGFTETETKVYHTVKDGKWVEVPAAQVGTVSIRELSKPAAVLSELQSLSATTATATPAPEPAPASLTAKPTANAVLVNGENLAFDAYNIGGNNYFKLRDLAYALNGSAKQFEVGYDNATKAITLTSGKSYTAAGGEMAPGDGKEKAAAPTPSAIYLDGKVLDLVVYNIGGANYFKLRDLMQALDVFVGYDNTTKAITLDTSKGYTPD